MKSSTQSHRPSHSWQASLPLPGPRRHRSASPVLRRLRRRLRLRIHQRQPALGHSGAAAADLSQRDRIGRRPANAGGPRACREDGYHSSALFTVHSGAVVVGSQAVRADNTEAPFQFSLGTGKPGRQSRTSWSRSVGIPSSPCHPATAAKLSPAARWRPGPDASTSTGSPAQTPKLPPAPPGSVVYVDVTAP